MPRPQEIYEALSELIFGEKGKTRATGSSPAAVAQVTAGAVVSLRVGRLRIDLHTHSTASDGTDPPAGVVAAAARPGWTSSR